ncbi:MAG: hypothetical protein ACLFTT_05245 [Candidatus Hydrogenedentota bacterium]
MEEPVLNVNMTMFVAALSYLKQEKGRRTLRIAYENGQMLLQCRDAPMSIPSEGTWPRAAIIPWSSLPKVDQRARPVFPKAQIALIGLEREVDIGGLRVPCKWED